MDIKIELTELIEKFQILNEKKEDKMRIKVFLLS